MRSAKPSASALLIGEVYLPDSRSRPSIWSALDIVFSFEALFAAGDAATLRAAIAAGLDIGQSGLGALQP